MGVILDSSAVIAGERKGQTAADVLAGLRLVVGPGKLALSTISVIELEHGIWRAKDPAVAARRQRFFADLFTAVPPYPVTFDIARLAARTDAEARNRGLVIPFQDLVIGVTALQLGYAVATLNTRHFQMIPNLTVIPL